MSYRSDTCIGCSGARWIYENNFASPCPDCKGTGRDPHAVTGMTRSEHDTAPLSTEKAQGGES